MVAIVIEERRRDRDARLVFDPALLRNVRERSIAVVVKQLIRPEIRQQQVDAAVVVDVARRGAEAVLPASMPLCAVTSVKCSTRMPSSRRCRSLRNRRPLNGSDRAGRWQQRVGE